MAELFYCVRQRAGNLVKEYRGTMPPRYAPSDTDEDRRAKADLKAQRRTVLNRDSTDRLELMIALMGKYATHYILEFDNEHLPERFADVRKARCGPSCGAWSAIEARAGLTTSRPLRGCTGRTGITSTSSRTTGNSRRRRCGSCGSAAR